MDIRNPTEARLSAKTERSRCTICLEVFVRSVKRAINASRCCCCWVVNPPVGGFFGPQGVAVTVGWGAEA